MFVITAFSSAPQLMHMIISDIEKSKFNLALHRKI